MIGPTRDPQPLGVFRYLNSLPVLSGILCGVRGGQGAFRLVYGTPAQCAARLAAGEVVGALIPSIEAARIPGIRLLPGVAISTHRRVRSVVLLHQRPLADCPTVAVDSSSRTSVALLRILLAHRHGLRPDLVPESPDPAAMLARHGAALLIADRALLPPPPGVTTIDLADEWHAFTGLPFVFALWAMTDQGLARLGPEGPSLFEASLHHGLERLPEIAAAEAPRLGLAAEDALAYLRENLSYRLGVRERQALGEFWRLAAAEGLLPAAGPPPAWAAPPSTTARQAS